MKQFNINKGATLPYLEIEPVVNGRDSFQKLYYAIQSAKVTFSMTNVDTGIKKIVNAPAYVVNRNDQGCEDRFKIQYRWTERDTKEAGRYIAQFKITFSDDIVDNGQVYPKGDLIVPIADHLYVSVNDCGVKV